MTDFGAVDDGAGSGVHTKISVTECRELLSVAVIGRIAFNSATGMQLIPVNFLFSDGNVYLQVNAASVMGQLGAGMEDVAFETDHHEDLYQQAWSVMVNGSIEQVTDQQEVERIRSHRQLQPWAVGDRNMFLRLTPRAISGRKVVRHAR